MSLKAKVWMIIFLVLYFLGSIQYWGFWLLGFREFQTLIGRHEADSDRLYLEAAFYSEDGRERTGIELYTDEEIETVYQIFSEMKRPLVLPFAKDAPLRIRFHCDRGHIQMTDEYLYVNHFGHVFYAAAENYDEIYRRLCAYLRSLAPEAHQWYIQFC